ncbi:GNAT family N-acetyltransferase [Pararhodonellum marinum]|uniref:GNAT family N-acetyltransferase n=1 Tax=Pararhodonellum marinum TaxID=2755358 RepID=UPI00188E18B6|nr:GNAT family N-acetyltransferase [Pararhodonellum marinum]
MIKLERTDAQNPEFRSLVEQLDQELAVTDGEDHAFYDQFNKVDEIKEVVVAYEEEIPQGCGAIKPFDAKTMEVKRMYVPQDLRGKGIAIKILNELEDWARELGYERCVLETGTRQKSAIALYQKSGYQRIPNYGQYEEMENSLCFEKML